MTCCELTAQSQIVADLLRRTASSLTAYSGSFVVARRGVMVCRDTAAETRSLGGSGAGGRPDEFVSVTLAAIMAGTPVTTAATGSLFALPSRQRAEKGRLIDEVLAARGAGSPVNFIVSPVPEDDRSLSICW